MTAINKILHNLFGHNWKLVDFIYKKGKELDIEECRWCGETKEVEF